MSKCGRPDGTASGDDEEASQAAGQSPQSYLSMPSTLPELKEREGGAFQESYPPQGGYGGGPLLHEALIYSPPTLHDSRDAVHACH